MPPASPSLARWELSIRLRERRLQLGMDIKVITDRLDFSRNYWSAVENNRTILAEEKLVSVVELFEFDETDAKEIMALREAAKQRGWWADFSAYLDDDVKELYGLEYGAQSVQTYEGNLITGLLQTEDYARAVIENDPINSPVKAEQLAVVRRRRQQRLREQDTLRVTALMSEAALHQETGGRTVFREQLNHLADVVQELSETVEVRIIPFSGTPAGVLGSSTFYILHFASPRLPPVAWVESIIPVGIIEQGDMLSRLSLAYSRSLDRSLSREDSLALIERRARELA